MIKSEEVSANLKKYANRLFEGERLKQHELQKMAVDMSLAVAVMEKQDNDLSVIREQALKGCASILKAVGEHSTMKAD